MKKCSNGISKARKFLAGLVSLSLVVGLFPTIVWADDDTYRSWPDVSNSTLISTECNKYIIDKDITYGAGINGVKNAQSEPFIIKIKGTVNYLGETLLFNVHEGYIEIVGEDNATINFSGTKASFINDKDITSGETAHVKIKNVTINCTSEDGKQPILLENSNTTTEFENVTFSNFNLPKATGVVALKAGTHTFTNCTFNNCTGVVSGAITVRGSATATMTNCTFTNCNAGNPNDDNPKGAGAIEVQNGASLTLVDCEVSNCGKVSGNETVTGAVIVQNGAGLVLKGSTTIANNPVGNITLRDGAKVTVDSGYAGSFGVNYADTLSANVKTQITVAGSTNYQQTLKNNGNIFADRNNNSLGFESNYLYLLRLQSPAIATQPTAPANNVYGATTDRTMSLVANEAGTGTLTYQWYSNTTNSTAGATPINGATGTSYVIPSDEEVGTHYYFCVVTTTINNDSVTNTTDIVEFVIVPESPVIVTQPTAPSNHALGGTTDRDMTVSASTTNAGTLTYQWFADGQAVNGATSATFTIPADATAGTHTYYCEVTNTVNGVGSTTKTNEVEFTIYDITPTIVAQPTAPANNSYGATTGRDISVSASAATGSVSYQWYSNTTNSTTGGTLINGATSNTYTIPSDEAVGTHYYYCEITNVVGNDSVTVATDVIEFVIVAETPTIASQPTAPANCALGGTTDRDITVNASVSEGTLTYQWYTNDSNSNEGGTAIGGATSATFTIPANETAGDHYYYCVITNTDGESVVTAKTDVVEVTIVDITPTIVAQPTAPANNFYGVEGRTISVEVNEGNDDDISYQWFVDGYEIVGAETDTYTIPSDISGTHTYYCEVTNTVGTNVVTTKTNEVEFTVVAATPVITTQPTVPADTSYLGTGDRTMTVEANVPGGTLSYQWYKDNVAIEGATDNSYAIPDNEPIGTHSYYCVVTNSGGGETTTATSDIVNVEIVAETPSISSVVTPAANPVYGTTENRTLEVNAGTSNSSTAGTITYQWYKNTTDSNVGGTAIDNANGSTYEIPDTEEPGTYYYYCEIINTISDGTTQSSSSTKTDAIEVVIAQGTPAVTASDITVSDITKGQTLSSSTISSSSTVSGTYAWKYPDTVANTIGTNEYVVVFTPTDTNYAPLEITVSLDVVGTVEMDGERLIGYTLSLDGDIGVNFYMELPADVIANKDSAYMKFTLPDGDQTRETKVYVSAATTYVLNGKTYYIFKCNVSAKDMTSEINAQIINGSEVGTVYKYSVQEYAQYILEHTATPKYAKAAPLVKAMLNYGAYAQIQFNNNIGELANSILSADDMELPENVTVEHASATAGNLPEGVTFAGAYVSLKSTTTLSLFFYNTSENEVTFKYNGQVIDAKDNNGFLQVDITNIKSSDLSKNFTVTVGENGSVTYSPMNYCKTVLEGNYNTDLQNVVKAFYLYSQEADAYFKTN